MNLQKVDIELLPVVAQEFIELIGIQHTETIIRERGGIRLYVPSHAKQDHWLAKLTSLDALKQLVARYGGDAIDIPRCDAAIRAIRELEIVNADESNATLARRYNYTERGIRKLKKRVGKQADDRQGKLL